MQKISAILLISGFLFPVLTLAQGSPPSLPLLIYGDITLNGSAAPAGTVVTIEKSGSEIARITLTTAGKYSTQIPASNAGATLIYKINGNQAAEKVCANPALVGSDRVNLSYGSAPASGGGGGGGSSNPPANQTTNTQTQLTPTQEKIDTNNDSKIDVMEFNLLMINWGNNTPGNPADFDGNGTVDILDFNLLMINWI